MKQIQTSEITTTGKATVIVLNPYLVAKIVRNLIKVEHFGLFMEQAFHTNNEGKPVFDNGSEYVPVEYLRDIYEEFMPFLQELDDAIEGE